MEPCSSSLPAVCPCLRTRHHGASLGPDPGLREPLLRSGTAVPLPHRRGPHGPCASPAPIPPRGHPSVQGPCWPHGARCHCRICYSDTSSPQEDQYPPNIAVKVNHSYCSVPVSGHPRAAVGDGAGGPPRKPFPRCERPRLLPGLLPLQQAGSGAQEALPPHQPHSPHVPVLGHQPHHRDLGELRQGEGGRRPPALQPGPLQAPPLPDRSSPTSPQSYSVALYLVRQLTSSELLQRLKTIGVKHPELCKALGELRGPRVTRGDAQGRGAERSA